MTGNKNNLVVRKDDYEVLLGFIRGGYPASSFDRTNAEKLSEELKKAKLVSNEKFPGDVVRLNSKVIIVDTEKNTSMEITLVTPDKADIKQRKISVLAPIGTALIGFRKGQQVAWHVPSGKKTFTIVDVSN
ncbi:MAG TPA: GreA/GreB family elongation factor [Flavisolibacter sp.]|nr:GreA/GreB family elongation factor [Flavisolibacter sp.]